MDYRIETDGWDYELFEECFQLIPTELEGLTCEIGLRRGGGSAYIMQSLAKRNQQYKVHVAIDPYGHLDYAWDENTVTKADYTNNMRDETLGDMYAYSNKLGINFIFFNLTDTEFFNRFDDGVPFYDITEHKMSKYIFCHLDGPHSTAHLIPEFQFFNSRMDSGAVIVFDNVTFYDFDVMHNVVKSEGWKTLKLTQLKAAYQKL